MEISCGSSIGVCGEGLWSSRAVDVKMPMDIFPHCGESGLPPPGFQGLPIELGEEGCHAGSLPIATCYPARSPSLHLLDGFYEFSGVWIPGGSSVFNAWSYEGEIRKLFQLT